MWFTVLFFVAGIPLGYLLRHQQWAIQLTDFVGVWAVRALLFLLGLTLGANDELFAQLDTLGVQAATVAISAVLGSLLGVRWLGQKLRLDEAMERQMGSGTAAPDGTAFGETASGAPTGDEAASAETVPAEDTPLTEEARS